MSDEGTKAEKGGKPKGWHSRRHESRDAHDLARDAYEKSHGPKARQKRALELRKLRKKRTSAEQAALLDRRLGKGVGSVKERTRLAA